LKTQNYRGATAACLFLLPAAGGAINDATKRTNTFPNTFAYRSAPAKPANSAT